MFANAIAPALLVAQAVGRVGNYFNQELFGKPSGLPWGLEIAQAHRLRTAYLTDRTFQPSFLYELIFDLALAAFLVWLGHHRQDPALGTLRALRDWLLGLPDLRGDDPDRLLGALPRPPAELLRGDHPDARRDCLVHSSPARACHRHQLRTGQAPRTSVDSGGAHSGGGDPGRADSGGAEPGGAEPGGATATAGPPEDGQDSNAQGELEASTGHTDP